MRKADRLFQIIQILRRARQPITADAIAVELETSKRSVYRDIATLMGQRVPIRGEAGMGYVLEAGFDLPPLMLTPDEIEAAVLGAQWVMARGDPALVRAAQDLVAKIAAAVPERLRPLVLDPSARTRSDQLPIPPDAIDMAEVRRAIHGARKIQLGYRDEKGEDTARKVWPIAIGYLETVRMMVAWCELRKDFRHFRTDRITAAAFLDERYPERPAALRAKWRAALRDRVPEKKT
ncbi:helix-turn-helix transcriptional regulator [Dongia sedimenti]|uniref:YafY family protein n=1 Tax=Dongia sedimenti TaxID=3064282 RepID=A0ABU0YUM9_9PROT|nr:YafY family protein [Rhodospirillaceae bacterium R-7]